MKTIRFGSLYDYVTVDLFDYKDEFIESLTDQELLEEVKKRNESNKHVLKQKNSHEVQHKFDLSDYLDEVLNHASEADLIYELEGRENYQVIEGKFKNTISSLAEILGLRWWSTKEQVLKEINENY